ncbi:uncharacterized protein HaLaN_32009, partial [Haematococcus lacustris]
ELDDGGGALPPASAGLVASYAEEEVANPDGVASDLARLDKWARSIPRPAVAAPLPSVRPSSPSTVHEPLFGSGQEAAAQEALLLGPVTGMWSERAAWLFVQLAKACDLEAVLIPGYWKGAGTVPPGDCLAAHNHCWAGGQKV